MRAGLALRPNRVPSSFKTTSLNFSFPTSLPPPPRPRHLSPSLLQLHGHRGGAARAGQQHRADPLSLPDLSIRSGRDPVLSVRLSLDFPSCTYTYVLSSSSLPPPPPPPSHCPHPPSPLLAALPRRSLGFLCLAAADLPTSSAASTAPHRRNSNLGPLVRIVSHALRQNFTEKLTSRSRRAKHCRESTTSLHLAPSPHPAHELPRRQLQLASRPDGFTGSPP